MAMTRKAVFMGVDISNKVSSWGMIETIKEILLVQATFMTDEMTLELFNDGTFSPAGSSLVAGVNWYNGLLEITVDGVTVYQGYAKDLRANNTRTLAYLVTENVLKGPAERSVIASGTGQNPADAMLAVLAAAGIDDALIDDASFTVAGGAARIAGATLNYNFLSGDNVTALAALQQIGNLASISVFVLNGRITARAFQPYQGDEQGLRNELNDANVREWGDMGTAYSNFQNRVLVGYPTLQYVTLDDERSQIENGNVVRELQFSAGDKVVSANAVSASYFGRLFLARASTRRTMIPLACGRDLKDAVIGDRFPVTNPRLGLVRYAMEVIESHRNLDTEEIELHLAQLQPA